MTLADHKAILAFERVEILGNMRRELETMRQFLNDARDGLEIGRPDVTQERIALVQTRINKLYELE